jgi:hypothetical protein
MANVVLPSSDEEAIKYAQQAADKVHNIYFVYSKIKLSGGIVNNAGTDDRFVFFTRISAQVYLTSSEFARFGDLLPTLLHEYKQKYL